MQLPPADGHDPDLARRLALFTAVVAAALLAAFSYLYGWAPSVPGATGERGPWRASVVGMMLIGGALGGCLYNLRGITKHVQEQDFFRQYELTYLLRPLSGALCGVFVFALLLSGVLTLTVGEGQPSLNERSVVLYLAVALLAGYGSQEFLRKVKDLNRTLFALSETEQREGASSNRTTTPDDRDAAT